ELKRFAEAQVYANKVLELIKTRKTQPQLLSKFYIVLTKYYIESRQYGPASIYIRKFDSLCTTMGADLTREKISYELKFRRDTALGHYKPAVTNLLASQKLNDSLFNESSNKQIKELEIEYETEKRKNEITELNQKNQVAQTRLDRAQLV